MIRPARVGLIFSILLFVAVQAQGGIPLTLGATYAGRIAVPGETNLYTFNGTSGQRLYFDSLDSDGIPISVTLLSPGGALLYQRNDDSDVGPWVLTEPGTYSLVFSPYGATTGNYEFRLLDLSAATTLTLGATLSDKLGLSLACNLYQFNGTRGQRINLQSLAYSTNLAQWQLVTPANVVLASGQIYQNLGTNTLPLDGPYTLMIIGAAPGSVPLSFQVLLSDVSDGPAAASGFGTSHSGTVNANQTNSFSYSAPAGLPVYFNSLDRSGVSLEVDLVDPSGNTVFSVAETADAGPFVLPHSGAYTLNVRGPGGTSGNFNFRLLDMTTSPALSLNTTVSNVLATPYETDIYQLAGTAGQRLYYDSLVSTFASVSIQLLGPDGLPLINGNFYSDQGPITLPFAGAYYLFLRSQLTTAPAYVFQMFDIGTQPVLPLNTDLSGTLAPNSSLLYQLAGTNGEQLYFNGKGVSIGGAFWTLYDARNNQVAGASASLGGDFELTLPYSCNYVLLLANGPNPVTYTNRVNTFTYATNALTLNTPVTNSIAHPGDQVVYTFTGAAGQRIYYDSLQTAFSYLYATLVSPSGTVLAYGNGTYDFGPQTLPQPGIYSLIFNGAGHTTGSFSFQLLDVAAQPVLPLNTDLSGTLPANLSLLYQVPGTSGEQLYFNGKGVTAGGASWTLYAPNNAQINAAALSQDFLQTLPYAGTYVLALQNGPNTLSYTNQVNIFSYITNALTLGTVVSNNIAAPGNQLFYTFSGTAGQRLYFDSLMPNYLSAYVTLLSPSGLQVAFANASYDFGPVTLPETGTYLLQFNGTGHTTGAISFQMLDVAAQPVLPLNVDLSGTLPANSTILYQVPGTYGQQLYFDSKGVTASGATWTLYGPNNANVNAAALSQDFLQTLPFAGNYVLAFQGGLNTLNYSNQVNSFSYITNSLTLSTEVTSAIVHPGDQLVYTFNGTAGQRLYFDSRLTNYINVVVTILSPAGVTVYYGNASYDSQTPFTLTQNGTYYLVLVGTGHTTGTVAFNLLDLAAAAPVSVGSTVTDSLSDRTETRLYRFAGTAGQRVNLQSLGSGGNLATWELIGLTDQTLGQNAYISANIGIVTLPATGNYVVAVIGNGTPGSSVSYQWTLTDVSDSTVTASGFGVVNSGNIGANQTNSFSYTASAGLPVFFDSQDASGQNLHADLFSPDGTLVFSIGETSDAGPFVLPRSGTYKLNVQGYGGASGNFSFRLLDLTASPTLSLNTPVNGVLSNPYETDVYQLTTSAGQTFIYNALTNDANYPSVFIQMLNPAGQAVGPGGDFQNSHGQFDIQYSGTSYVFLRNLRNLASIYSFQFLDVASQPVLPINAPVTNTLGVYPEPVYRYSGTAGQLLYFHGQSANPSGYWSLYDPNSAAVPGSGSSLAGDFEVTLPYSGTYALLLQNSSSAAGTEIFEVNTFSYITNKYTVDTPVVDAIGQPGERRFYTFAGSLGQRLFYNALTNDPPSPNTITAQLLNPQGAPEGPISGRFSFNRGPFSLQQSGTYTLVMDGISASTGTFAFQLLDISNQPALPLNAPVSKTLDVYPVEVYQYAGTAGQQFYFRGQAGNPGGNWNLYDPDNNQVPSAAAGLGSDFEVTLPMSGTYALVLQNYSGVAGTETFQVNDFSYFTNAYTIGTPVVSAINRPGERRFYTFTGTIGQRLIYNALTNGSYTITAQLLNPQGAPEGPVSGGFLNNHGPFALQQSGTYTLVIDGSLSSIGPFAFQLLDVASQPALPLSSGVTNTLDAFALEVYQYTGLPGQHLYFRGLSSNPSGNWTLYDPNNTSLGSATLLGDFQVSLSVAGTYALVLGNSSGASGTEVFAVNTFNSGETLLFNSAPVLSHIGNKAATVGAQLTFTAQATDSDNDSLTFSLDPGSPAGATINPTTGAFSWTPPAGSPSLTQLTVRVTDNGVPNLSAAETITISIQGGSGLQIITVQLGPGTATPVWHSIPGKQYRLLYKNNLQDANWTAVGADVTATDVTASQVDSTIGASSTRFYEVEQLN